MHLLFVFQLYQQNYTKITVALPSNGLKKIQKIIQLKCQEYIVQICKRGAISQTSKLYGKPSKGCSNTAFILAVPTLMQNKFLRKYPPKVNTSLILQVIYLL